MSGINTEQKVADTNRKLPLDLKILAWVFILEGTGWLVDLVLDPSTLTSVSGTVKLFGALNLPLGIGLLFRCSECRILALVSNWIRLILAFLLLSLTVLVASDTGKEALLWGAAAFGLPLCLWIWCFWVLIRQRTRLAFGIVEPIRYGAVALRWTAVLLLLVIGIPVAVNLVDQEITPEARRLGEFPPNPIPKEKNAYYALMGFSAPASEDPARIGQLIVSDFTTELNRHGDKPGFEYDRSRVLKGKPLEVKDSAGVLCETTRKTRLKPDSLNCIQVCRIRREEIRRMLADNEALLARYRSLFRYEGLVEEIPLTLETPLLDGGPVRKAQALLLTQAALDWCEGRHERALELLRDDLRLWRGALISTRTLFGKLSSLGSIRSDLALILMMFQDQEPPNVLIREMRNLLMPLSEAEKDMSNPIRGEFQERVNEAERRNDFLGSPKISNRPIPSYIRKPASWAFFKPNATVNRLYGLYNKWLQATQIEPASFRIGSEIMDEYVIFREGWRFFYNPLGKLHVAITVPIYTSFIEHMHDTDALMRLVRLQTEIRLRGITPETMHEFLKSVDPRLFDPYTGKPMRWNTKSGELYSVGNSEAESGDPEKMISIPIRFFTDVRRQ